MRRSARPTDSLGGRIDGIGGAGLPLRPQRRCRARRRRQLDRRPASADALRRRQFRGPACGSPATRSRWRSRARFTAPEGSYNGLSFRDGAGRLTVTPAGAIRVDDGRVTVGSTHATFHASVAGSARWPSRPTARLPTWPTSTTTSTERHAGRDRRPQLQLQQRRPSDVECRPAGAHRRRGSGGFRWAR